MDVVYHDAGYVCEECGEGSGVVAIASYIRNCSDEPVYVCSGCISKTLARMRKIEHAIKSIDGELKPGECDPATGEYNPNVDGE